jgi:endoglucanase
MYANRSPQLGTCGPVAALDWPHPRPDCRWMSSSSTFAYRRAGGRRAVAGLIAATTLAATAIAIAIAVLTPSANAGTGTSAATPGCGTPTLLPSTWPTDPTNRPGAPTNVHATAVMSSWVSLEWNPAVPNGAPIVEYVVAWSGAGGSCQGIVSSNAIDVTGLSPRTTYRFTVFARDSANRLSVGSTAITVTTTDVATPPPSDTTPPSAPGTPSTSNLTSTGVLINWGAATDNVGVTGYQLTRTGPGSTTMVATVPAVSTGYLEYALTPATTYQYAIRALDAAGNLSTPALVTVTTPAGSCRVSYVKQSEWSGGFVAQVTITNTGSGPLTNWALGWTFPGAQRITNAWNATITPASGAVTARGMAYNATIAAGQSVSFGFQGTWSGTNAVPAAFAVNGAGCVTG